MPNTWIHSAAGYARDHGWQVIPLHPNRGRVKDDATIIEDHLQHGFIMSPKEGSSSPDEILAWDLHGDYRIGVVTGAESNLIALEIEGATSLKQVKTEVEPLLGPLPDTRCIEGPDRSYILFQYPGRAESMPCMRPKRNLILHGEESVIQAPLMTGEANLREYFLWSLRGGNSVAEAPRSLLSFFGIRSGQPANNERRTVPNIGSIEPGLSETVSVNGSTQGDGARSNNGTLPSLDTRDHQNSPGGRSPFRSGSALRLREEDRGSFLGVPWLIQDGLTLLTGPPKTSGKSSFVLSLAASLASGWRFLDYGMQAVPVVLATDFAPRVVRRVLHQLGIRKNKALSRLHVLHPKDVGDRFWKGTFTDLYDHAHRVGAPVVLVDSLDQYVHIREGIDPTQNPEVAQVLTTEAPAGISVLAVKATECGPDTSFQESLSRLGVLVQASDLVVRMQNAGTPQQPTLRHLQAVGRSGIDPPNVLYELTQGTYERRQSGGIGLPSRLRQSGNSVQPIMSNGQSDLFEN